MTTIVYCGIVFTGYLIGSIPFGYLIVRIFTKKDLRQIQSGRTGGTNAMRAAGVWAGAATAVFDFLKGASAVWLAQIIVPQNPWLYISTAIATILGHNYSIFLIERNKKRKIRFRGGAGGATTAGSALAFWPPVVLILIPIAVLILFGIGYASVATMSVPILIILIFTIRASIGISPWAYVVWGLVAELILIWALRPNIKRLFNGTERLVGWRVKKNKTGTVSLPTE